MLYENATTIQNENELSNDDYEPSYVKLLKQRQEYNNPDEQYYQSYVQDTQPQEIPIEDEEVELSPWLRVNQPDTDTDIPIDDIPTMGVTNDTVAEPTEKNSLEDVADGFIDLIDKATWPIRAPFVKGSQEENPVLRGAAKGSVDTLNNLLGVARDLTNLGGGEFSEDDWLKIPQFIQENPDSIGEEVVAFIVQFMAPFGLLGGMAKGASTMKMVNAELGALATFDPNYENMAVMLKSLGLDSEMLDYLAQPAGKDADTYERLVSRAKTVFVEAPLAFLGPVIVGGIRKAKEIGLGDAFKDLIQSGKDGGAKFADKVKDFSEEPLKTKSKGLTKPKTTTKKKSRSNASSTRASNKKGDK